MRLLSLAGLLLQLGAVCGQKVFTLEQIEDQIEAFLESNATITERSGLPSGCTLAVRTKAPLTLDWFIY